MRSQDPDEEKVSDINVLVFDSNGRLEAKFQRHYGAGGFHSGESSEVMSLAKGGKYSIFVAANLGYSLPCQTLEDAENYVYHLAYPDEYGRGMAMSCFLKDISIDGNPIAVRLERIMAKVSIRMDRSLLSSDVSMFVRGVRIGNCPKHASLFKEGSLVTERSGLFVVPFSKNDLQCTVLNEKNAEGKSEELELYLLENCQGEENEDFSSYVEIDFDYSSDERKSNGDKYLKYRFYIDGKDKCNVRRGCQYPVLVRPEGKGLKGDGWRVDASGLVAIGAK